MISSVPYSVCETLGFFLSKPDKRGDIISFPWIRILWENTRWPRLRK